MTEFKIGDMVKIIKDDASYSHLIGICGKIVKVPTLDSEIYHVEFDKPIVHGTHNINSTTRKFKSIEMVLVKNGKVVPEKPDDLVRYIAFGHGCNNRGNVRKTEPEMKDDLKKYSRDSSWTGKIVGYKMVPLYEAELKTQFKSLQKLKIKKVVKKPAKKK